MAIKTSYWYSDVPTCSFLPLDKIKTDVGGNKSDENSTLKKIYCKLSP